MPALEIEQVMVVKTEQFRECGYFQGFTDQHEKYLPTLLDPANTQYLPRPEMEQDPRFKQLIPYCLIQYIDETGAVQLFQYRRGKGQGESRLHAKRSIGIGGHISTLDAEDASPYHLGMQRELDEEVIIDSPYAEKQIGMINDDKDEVGRVHLGIVHLLTLETPRVTARESEIIESGFRPVAELLEEIESFETWSQICLKAIFADTEPESESADQSLGG